MVRFGFSSLTLNPSFLSYEGAGVYDHVSPHHTVSPDGIKPQDLLQGDICTQSTGPTCDFVYTGYRVPLIVASSFTKKNYVSHKVPDYTAILKLIETRFDVPSLTARDAHQMNMGEFFDFSNPLADASISSRTGYGPCYLNQLP